jgi:hypothetical protein
MDERLKIIDDLCGKNLDKIREMNKVASQSRQPMSKSDRKRCSDLRNSNYHLCRARYLIVQTLAEVENEGK